jgi:DNA replication protein DnaC
MDLDNLYVTLRGLKLPAFVDHAADLASRAEREGWGYLGYLQHLAELEAQQRQERRIDRRRRQSGLPHTKTLDTFLQERLTPAVRRGLTQLCDGEFVAEARNVLAFGLPGRGKTHLVCAIGHALVQRGYSVLFLPTYKLVQRLLAAKEQLRLDKELHRLDAYDAVILDDIGYVQQNRDEMEVLFTFLAERYERKSVLITSNLVFSQWGRIFKDPMTTAAAIDRLVHHAVILELTGSSFRTDAAKGTPTEAVAAAAEQTLASDNGPRSATTTTEPTPPPATTTPGEQPTAPPATTTLAPRPNHDRTHAGAAEMRG